MLNKVDYDNVPSAGEIRLENLEGLLRAPNSNGDLVLCLLHLK